MKVTKITPAYDRSALKPRILHIGFGAFARAHQMVYLDELLSQEGGDWGVMAVRLNSGAQALSALDAANGLYTVIEADDDTLTAREIGVIAGTCHPERDGRDRLLDAFGAPDLAIVSLTITEKGYCLSGHTLDLDHKGIKADLDTPTAPKTAIGVIVEGLARRRAAGQGGLTVMSCDNLPENGALAKAAVLAFAQARDAALARWIENTCRFPATMVDRIVPALDADSAALIEEVTGHEDANGILCEPFCQWVIEDNFAGPRPAWEKVGVQIVPDVRPFEDMKLRMLNGAHTFIANLGAVTGHATVASSVADPVFRAAARQLMGAEQAATLAPLSGVDLDAYADALIARFGNARLQHRTTQIATDTSAKLPQRLLAPAKAHLADGSAWPLTALGIAGWMLYLRGKDEAGNDLPLCDPLADALRDIVAAQDGAEYVSALLSLRAVFDADLAHNAEFAAAIQKAYAELTTKGVRAAINARLHSPVL
ncbi:Polyol:NADP oxidoreductase [Aquimixticola soesokkakensis]|uniref:Polyol:NADP oxidoreductase n=1 Tax=Aquimixticola soesokkakensis TaxID=1519096 RepID=A0A1Y5RQP1_9RHOB|nr:mannitol dehydrogenase family protein [Aquimixticola soesokkakensis]SLN23035.1 Polyol:NADP oxidoreductase [Aquimixticola soesokkakensis]